MFSASNSSLFSLSQQLLCINRRVDLRILRHGAASARFSVLLGHELWGVPGLSGKVGVGRPLAETGPQSVARRRTGGEGRTARSTLSTRSSVRTSRATSWTQLQSDQTQPDGRHTEPSTDRTQHHNSLVSEPQTTQKLTECISASERFWVQYKLNPFRSTCGSVLIESHFHNYNNRINKNLEFNVKINCLPTVKPPQKSNFTTSLQHQKNPNTLKWQKQIFKHLQF